VASSATIATGSPQWGQSRSAAGSGPVVGGGTGRVRVGPAGRSGLALRQAAVLHAGLQYRVRAVSGIGVAQAGQVRVSAGTGGHRLAQCRGVVLVGAQPVGRAVDPDDGGSVQEPV
jgi:hypothetical protein